MIDVALLEEQALSLNFRERGRLASSLIRSLDDDKLTEEEIEKLWLDEAVRRNKEMDDDPSVCVPGDVVLQEMRELLK